jgi:hypothetical protein
MFIKVLLIIFSMGFINPMNYYSILYEKMLNMKKNKTNDFPWEQSKEFNNEPISIEKDSEKIIANDKQVIFSRENLKAQFKSPFIIGHSIIFTLEILSTLSCLSNPNTPFYYCMLMKVYLVF